MSKEHGFRTITPVELANVFAAFTAGKIGTGSLRVYFGCHELVAIREAARRARRRGGNRGATRVRYSAEELERLTGLSAVATRRALARLQRAGLVQYSPECIEFATAAADGSEALMETLRCKRSGRRPIPFPRPVLRFLANCGSIAITKTMVAYVVRALSLSRQSAEVRSRGTVKVSWIVRAMGISERAVRYARKQLIELGWIGEDTGSTQWKLNRDGAYFIINLAWGPVTRDKPAREFAPPGLEKRTAFAPPIEDLKTSIEAKDQETARSDGAGVSAWSGGRPPSFRDIQAQDLRSFGRLESLYHQAATMGVVQASEARALDFIAAAVRAREACGDSVRIFAGIVRRGLWSHLTQAQEDRARRALAHYRELDPNRFQAQSESDRGSATTWCGGVAACRW